MTAVSEEEEVHKFSKSSKDKWYRIPYLRGSNTIHQLYICRKLLQAPCVCCGQNHPEAEIAIDEETGAEYGRYTCDVSKVCGKSFTYAVTEEGIDRHIPCPKLFALRYGYQMSDIALAWDIFMEKGYGHCIPYRKLRNLWEDIVVTCEEERAAWTFTRDNSWRPNTNDEGEEEEMEEEQDLKQDDPTKWELAKSNF